MIGEDVKIDKDELCEIIDKFGKESSCKSIVCGGWKSALQVFALCALVGQVIIYGVGVLQKPSIDKLNVVRFVLMLLGTMLVVGMWIEIQLNKVKQKSEIFQALKST